MNNSQTIRESSVKWQRPCTAKGPEWNQFKIRQNKSKMYKRKGTFVNCAFRHSVSNMINILPEIYRQFPWVLRHVITMSPARVQPGTFVALCHPCRFSTVHYQNKGEVKFQSFIVVRTENRLLSSLISILEILRPLKSYFLNQLIVMSDGILNS